MNKNTLIFILLILLLFVLALFSYYYYHAGYPEEGRVYFSNLKYSFYPPSNNKALFNRALFLT